MNEPVNIQSSDDRFKVVEMFQQHWALIKAASSGVTVYFIHDTSGVFDEMRFATADVAAAALRLNGFRRDYESQMNHGGSEFIAEAKQKLGLP